MSDEFDAHEGQLPAAPTSGLAGLRAQRAKIQQALHLDHRVPRYETPVYVRFNPAPGGVIKRITDRAQKAKNPDAVVDANAQLLAECCVGVFEKDAAGKPIGDPDQWPKFDKTLAEYLGHEDAERAADVVKLLFFTDGDIAAAVAALTRWSGFAEAEADEEFEGN